MCQRVLRSKNSVIASFGLFIWTRNAEYLTFLKNCCFLENLDKKVHGSSRRRELSNSVVVCIHQEKKNTFVLLIMCHESVHFF